MAAAVGPAAIVAVSLVILVLVILVDVIVVVAMPPAHHVQKVRSPLWLAEADCASELGFRGHECFFR